MPERIIIGQNFKIGRIEFNLPASKEPFAVEVERSNEVSDGYHTFGELYEHRCLLFCLLSREYSGWKSWKHSDGSLWEGWFIAGLRLGSSSETDITYYLPASLWDNFDCFEVERAPEFDGHTSRDVIERLKRRLKS